MVIVPVTSETTQSADQFRLRSISQMIKSTSRVLPQEKV